MPKKRKFEPGDIVSVALDGRDPAHRLRRAKRTITQYGVGVVFGRDSDDDVLVKWFSAPLEFYYRHADDFDVYVTPDRCTKLGEVPHG